MLHLRDVAERTRGDFSIVREMLEMRNRELAEVTRADDFRQRQTDQPADVAAL